MGELVKPLGMCLSGVCAEVYGVFGTLFKLRSQRFGNTSVRRCEEVVGGKDLSENTGPMSLLYSEAQDNAERSLWSQG